MEPHEPKPTRSKGALSFSVESPQGAVDSAPPTFALIHGFPDTPSVWRGTVEHLLSRGSRVILIALPGFEEDEALEGRGHQAPTFEETTERLHQTLIDADALGATLIGHDWGAIFSYMLLERYPQAASRLVTLEVGCSPRSLRLALCVIVYHGLINLAYSLGTGLGDRLMRWICLAFPRPVYEGAITPKAHHGWLYRQAWREGGVHGPWLFYFRNVIARWTPAPTLPFLFLFGKDGPRWLRFHSTHWLKRVTAYNSASQAVALPGGHWSFAEHPDAFFAALDRFLDASTSGPASETDDLA